jgi:hypothetical protein
MDIGYRRRGTEISFSLKPRELWIIAAIILALLTG